MNNGVLVLGDGPAGALIAAACRRVGLDVAVVGGGRPWTSTYAAWRDDVEMLPDAVFASTRARVAVRGRREVVIGREYGVFDNAALRCHLGVDDVRVPGTAARWRQVGERAEVDLTDGSTRRAAFVVDATGAPADVRPIAWQTAFGVFVDEVDLPAGVPRDAVTLMRWRDPVGARGGGVASSFLYAVPVGGRWLVEETVLAADPAVPPDSLRDLLVARLGDRVVGRAEAAGDVERVSIPMGLPVTVSSGRIVPFGAAAGMIHPATGYSVGTAARAADRVAAALAAGDPDGVGAQVWPRAHRDARRLHEYGLRALLALDAEETAAFFDVFFSLPIDDWRPYLRVDTSPAAVASVMRRVFAASPWSVRRRLLGTAPRDLVQRLARR